MTIHAQKQLNCKSFLARLHLNSKSGIPVKYLWRAIHSISSVHDAANIYWCIRM